MNHLLPFNMIYKYIYIYISIYTYIYVYIYTYTCVHTSLFSNISCPPSSFIICAETLNLWLPKTKAVWPTYMYINTYIHMLIYIYIYTFKKCKFKYICMHLYTQIHIIYYMCRNSQFMTFQNEGSLTHLYVYKYIYTYVDIHTVCIYD
jgi:hypothetical protein